MFRGFRDFIMRGNVVDLAVAVVIGAAFGAVITAFVADIITPLIAAIFGKPDFSTLTFTINSSTFKYGSFINAVISSNVSWEGELDPTDKNSFSWASTYASVEKAEDALPTFKTLLPILPEERVDPNTFNLGIGRTRPWHG